LKGKEGIAMTTALGLIVQLLPALAAGPAALAEPVDTPRTRKRVEAIEYSNFYNARLKLHRWLSFGMIPLFVGSYVTGDKILTHPDDAPRWAKRLHGPFAAGTAVVFGVNTVTGLWNLWESRKDPAGRAKRMVHSLLFIAADAGFTYAASIAHPSEDGSTQNLHRHRNIALASMGVSLTGWAMMLFFK
jgi:hypothetical protein